eukprot:TRINITY_DN71724_c0_g1_i1.p4 TRINITY_DN71724_c0_g1~~TRINITY_DN71724_c0_g1_i1.p4  ORF type:complete len:279 (-),score=38.84 TRINITY_DN71724_c0_g1_i1:2373-3209(-)
MEKELSSFDMEKSGEEGPDEYPEDLEEPVERPKVRHKKEETLVTMLELLAGNKDNVEVNENVINEQKEKAEQMISELQTKMQQITLEEPLTPSAGSEEKEIQAESLQKSGARPSTFKVKEQDIVGQYDFALGKVSGGIANLFCSDKLQIVQIPASFVPKGTKSGGIITVSIARKKAEEEARDKLIIDIQDAILEYEKQAHKEDSKRIKRKFPKSKLQFIQKLTLTFFITLLQYLSTYAYFGVEYKLLLQIQYVLEHVLQFIFVTLFRSGLCLSNVLFL